MTGDGFSPSSRLRKRGNSGRQRLISGKRAAKPVPSGGSSMIASSPRAKKSLGVNILSALGVVCAVLWAGSFEAEAPRRGGGRSGEAPAVPAAYVERDRSEPRG